MVSLFLLALSFTTILSMDTEGVEDSSSDAFQILDKYLKELSPISVMDDERTSDSGNQNIDNEMPHTDVQAGAVVTGTIHDDDIHEDGEGEDRFQLLRDKLQELKQNERKKIKKLIGNKLFNIIVYQIKKMGNLELMKQKKIVIIEINREKRLAKLKMDKRDALTGYKERRQAIEIEHDLEISQTSEDFEKSQAELDLKFVEMVNELIEFVKKELLSTLGKNGRLVVDVINQKKEIEKEMHNELASLRQTVVEQADQEQIQKVVNELKDYIERTGRQPIKVIGVIDDNLYKPFINYAKEVNYYGKKSDEVLKISCSNLIFDKKTAEKCKDTRMAIFWMYPKDIIQIYNLMKKQKDQK